MVCKYNTLHWDIIFQIRQSSISAFQQLHRQLIILFLNHSHRRSVEHAWETLISCIEQGVNCTVKNVTKKHGRSYLLYSSSEINPLANSMQNRPVLRYTKLIIDCHCQTHGENEVIKSTVNLAFRILQPKITKIQKIQ